MKVMKSLGEVCRQITDGTHYTPEDVGEGVPFLTVKDVSDEGLDFTGCSHISQADFEAAHRAGCTPLCGDVMFSKDGTVGKVHVVRESQPFAVLSSLAILRPNPAVIDPDYLGVALAMPKVLDQALKKKTGSAIRRIILSDLREVRIPVPSLPEQRRIAAILDHAEALRAKRRAALAKLDTLAQSIFIEMFGDPDENPKGFPISELQDLCTKITDGTHQSPSWVSTGIPFLFISNIVNGLITFDTDKYISRETYVELTRRCPIENGDVLFTTVGSYGNAAVVNGEREFCFQRHIAHIKPNQAKLAPAFLAAMIESPGVRRQVDRAARGVAQKTVNLADLKALKVFAPPLEIQRVFTNKLTLIQMIKGSHLKANAVQEGLLRSLQHLVFFGEL